MQNENWGDNAQDEEEPLYDGPSKSQRKRDSNAMQELGAELTRLPVDVLARAELPEDIMGAIAEFRRMKSFGAQRRQLQFLGKVMRGYDGEAIREAVARANGTSTLARSAKRRCERQIELFITAEDPFTAFVETHPECDIKRIRQLSRLARKERETQAPKRAAAKELYQILYALELPPVTDFYRHDDEEE